VDAQSTPGTGSGNDVGAKEQQQAVRERAEKEAKLRLLRDLVRHGLYQVDSESVADRLLERLLTPGCE
jgi:anti-sigma28 factor (negative regulator of flagellin synthesis)